MRFLKELEKICEVRHSPAYGKYCIIGECFYELGDMENAFKFLHLSYQENPSYIKNREKKYLAFVLRKLALDAK